MRLTAEEHSVARTERPRRATAVTALAAMHRPGELWALSTLVVAYALIYAVGASALYSSANIAGPVALTAILGWSCYRIVRQSSIAIWAPLFWFRLACSAYYGFGALVPNIVNEATQQRIYALYLFDDETNLQVNLIYSLGVTCALAFSNIFLRLRLSRRFSSARDTDSNTSSQTRFFSALFLSAGILLRYFFVVPYTFGVTDGILPGALVTISNVYYAGIYMSIVYGISHNKSVIPAVWMLISFDVAVSIASFAKTDLLFILIFSFLGFISHGATRAKIVLGACCVLLAYFAFQPLVGYGREQLAMRYGEIRGAGLSERWDIVESYFSDDGISVKSGDQSGLSRLSYLGISAFVVDRYDAGMPGGTLRNAAAVFVPRALWPDKPIITQLGSDLNFLVFGREGSSLGVGHFAEAYWNFGWWGFAPFMALLALALSIFTKCSMKIMAERDWLFLPVVFVGVKMGLRVDGHFVPDVIGSCWIALSLGLGLTVLDILVRGKRLHQRSVRFRNI